MKVRINKLISNAGLGSRREVESLIRAGRITLNGKRADLGDMVGEKDVVVLDGLDLPIKELVREHIALEKVIQHEKSKQDKPRTQDKASERAESQRQKHASKSAELRKTSRNNPVNRQRAKAILQGEEQEPLATAKPFRRTERPARPSTRTSNKPETKKR